MSWSFSAVGRNKEKLKERVRTEQVKDEVNQPHSGIPGRVADFLCAEIDRCRIYDFAGKTYGLSISGNGSFHEQGIEEHVKIHSIELVE